MTDSFMEKLLQGLRDALPDESPGHTLETASREGLTRAAELLVYRTGDQNQGALADLVRGVTERISPGTPGLAGFVLNGIQANDLPMTEWFANSTATEALVKLGRRPRSDRFDPPPGFTTR